MDTLEGAVAQVLEDVATEKNSTEERHAQALQQLRNQVATKRATCSRIDKSVRGIQRNVGKIIDRRTQIETLFLECYERVKDEVWENRQANYTQAMMQ